MNKKSPTIENQFNSRGIFYIIILLLLFKKKNNIPLIRIPYTKLDSLTIDDLLLKEVD